ncbi:MAG: DEAD/DEAH box helicase family protein [Candidatus Aenigmarchaeota archaeon]|nr:DEAD/DEAH box helicase family protein [Candidatus Aenigmarchaeota archaeon]
MTFVSNPWLNEGIIEYREYQEKITKAALTGNTLCVLPTGLGKTNISAIVAAHRLDKDRNGKILFLAPTRPLVSQHKKNFEKYFKAGLKMKVITGEDMPENRVYLYRDADIIFSTPQTIQNDLKNRSIKLDDFILCIFDEAHRSVGNYAYPFVAKKYVEQSKSPLILALTASPGGRREKINEVKNRLFIKNVEIRTREDSDVKPYVQQVSRDWIKVELPTEMKTIRNYLERIRGERISKLLSWKIISYPRPSKSDLLKLQNDLAKRKTGFGYAAMSVIAEVIKTDHSLMLLETQCLYSLQKYFDKMLNEKSKASQRLLASTDFRNAMRLTNELLSEGKEHPKIAALRGFIAEELNDKDARIIIFAQLRDTIERIRESLSDIKGAAPVEFIGQAKKKGKGMSQKEQLQILNEFSMGFHNILIASQIGEEGLDIAETSAVVFYEPIPSAVRSIQRAGRTARTKPGKVVVLMTKDSRDEAYYWSGHQKERKMHGILYGMQHTQKKGTLKDFVK